MVKVLVLGAGISGHTAAAYLRRKLGRKHQVIVVSPSAYYQWVPSNIWVGVGKITVDQVRFKLKNVYDRWCIDFRQAKATTLFLRKNLLWQACRFIALNLKIMRIIVGGHS
jgi:sulfide:quinone oxidoreductase